MKTAELTGAALALWVAKAIRLPIHSNSLAQWVDTSRQPFSRNISYITGNYTPRYTPHENWAYGGPLIDEFAIGFKPISDAEWLAEEYIAGRTGRGPTPLIAAMRALVASVYGDTVPDEEAA